MQPKSPKWLEDIAEASDRIAAWTARFSFAEYEGDPFMRGAVERNVEIIGEAMIRLERTDPEIALRITDHRRVIGLRNRLTYDDDPTDHSLVWDAIHDVLPTLRAEVAALMVETENDGQDQEHGRERAAMHSLVADNLDAIRALARAYGVARLEVFGSVCTPGFDPDRSDVDFLVAYPPGYDFGPWGGRHSDLQVALAAALGHDVDLISMASLEHRWVRREAAKTRILVYAADQGNLAG